MTPDTSAWTRIGRSSNADFFEVEPGILAVVPFDGITDNAATAAESIRVQLEYLRPKGMRAGVLVFMDRVAEQDSGARAVYREAPDPAFHACFALVGSTIFGRAVSSVFIGLHPPRVPTRMFGTLEEAIAWIRETVQA
ncbi:MAG: hypothetical protein HY048_00600 [Acidobacteria bacterium]|nr:hypothetical protein [Acidobacteriota bacterium]